MKNHLQRPLADYLIALADDELVLAHRHSEWCAHGPILEEDIAFTNLCLDEIGHATIWYQAAADLLGEAPKTYPDKLAYFRGPSEFRCIQMAELPNGDWAFSMLRQYLFDSFEILRLEGLKESSYQPVADAAAKILNEEIYHLRHTGAWLKRLGLGTEDSNRRMQAALDTLWPYALQLVQSHENEEELAAQGLLPATSEIGEAWKAKVSNALEEAQLEIPDVKTSAYADRAAHSDYFEDLLAEMQQVARLIPEAIW